MTEYKIILMERMNFMNSYRSQFLCRHFNFPMLYHPYIHIYTRKKWLISDLIPKKSEKVEFPQKKRQEFAEK